MNTFTGHCVQQLWIYYCFELSYKLVKYFIGNKAVKITKQTE